MSEPRRFDFRELAGADDPSGDAELGAAFAAARRLEDAISGPDVRPSADLADRIMAAVAHEPAPRAVGIVAALRRRPGPAGLVDSLRLAWARALTSGRPMGLRAGALAYVAAVALLAVSLTGAAAYTTAGAIGHLIGADATRAPITTPGLPTPGPLLSPEPRASESAEPSETPEASETVEPSDDNGGATTEPGEGGGGGDGSGSSSSPTSSDDHGGDGGSSGSGGSSPTQTPRPSGTPKASETPKPSQTSGSDG